MLSISILVEFSDIVFNDRQTFHGSARPSTFRDKQIPRFVFICTQPCVNCHSVSSGIAPERIWHRKSHKCASADWYGCADGERRSLYYGNVRRKYRKRAAFDQSGRMRAYLIPASS